MRRFLMGALMALSLSPVMASATEMPPPAAQMLPSVQVGVTFKSIAETDRLCRQMGAPVPGGQQWSIWACTRGQEQVMPDPCEWLRKRDPHDGYAKLACHENAHVCPGGACWRHDDPK